MQINVPKNLNIPLFVFHFNFILNLFNKKNLALTEEYKQLF